MVVCACTFNPSRAGRGTDLCEFKVRLVTTVSFRQAELNSETQYQKKKNTKKRKKEKVTELTLKGKLDEND